MHLALHSRYILSNILDFVDVLPPNKYLDDPLAIPGSSTASGNKTLACLARTCKLFQDPALNVLWRTLRDISPLARTFPAAVWEEEVVDRDNEGRPLRYKLYFNKPPTPSDWSRFDFYAHRVQDLGYFRNELADAEEYAHHLNPSVAFQRRVADRSVMEYLCLARRRDAPLPNLARVRLNRCDRAWADLLPFLLVGSRVRCLALRIHFEEDRSQTILPRLIASLPDICPTLTQLEVFTCQPEPVVDAAVLFSQRCPRLESFVVHCSTPWSEEVLCHLASQPYLRKVHLGIDAACAVDLTFLYHATTYYPFPALQKLWLDVPSVAACSELLRVMNTCQLHTLDLTATERIMPDDLQYLFVCLHHRCISRTLQVLHIMGPYQKSWGEGAHSQEEELYGTDLEFLLVFTRMRRFKLLAPLVIWLDNTDLRSIADSWPLLIEMRIGGYGWRCLPSITWSGLAYLLWKCPETVALDMPFDSTADDIEAVTSLPDFRPNRTFRAFFMQDSILGDAETFAHNLFAVAPLTVCLNGFAYEHEESGIYPPIPPSIFYSQAETIMWELRRTRMRDQFAFLDEYVYTEADLMNDFGKPPPPFPYVRFDDTHYYRR